MFPIFAFGGGNGVDALVTNRSRQGSHASDQGRADQGQDHCEGAPKSLGICLPSRWSDAGDGAAWQAPAGVEGWCGLEATHGRSCDRPRLQNRTASSISPMRSQARAGLRPRWRVGSSARSGLDDVEVIFRQVPKINGNLHFGSRLAFAPDGTLFITLGSAFNSRRPRTCLMTWARSFSHQS